MYDVDVELVSCCVDVLLKLYLPECCRCGIDVTEQVEGRTERNGFDSDLLLLMLMLLLLYSLFRIDSSLKWDEMRWDEILKK